MARIADSYLFRARAVHLSWTAIAARQQAVLRRSGLERPKWFPDPKALRRRGTDIHLAWVCAKGLGVPRGPFTVWTRERGERRLHDVDTITFQRPEGLGIWWGGREAASVEVICEVDDPSRPVALFLYRTSPSLHDVVSATALPAGGQTPVTLRVDTPGATMAVLVNGHSPGVLIELLEDVVNAPEWRRVEIVGLPIDQPWDGVEYDASDQGPVAAPLPPAEAAIARLVRGSPLAGWWPATETGHPAPEWVPPDPKLLVGEVRGDLLPRITELYDGGVPEFEQSAITRTHVVPGPQQDGKTSSLETKAELAPWGLLVLPAQTDPFLNLATGFGSSYSVEAVDPSQIGVGESDFLVTADYAELRAPHEGPAQLAAYAPAPEPHLELPDPTGLTDGRDGLVPPPTADLPWRETVRVSWDRLPVTAALASATESALARFSTAPASPAESLLPERTAGGPRPLVISADGPPGQPGYNRVSVVDGSAEIPIGSGGRQVGYAVAVSDLYGVWSEWRDVAYVGDEPAPEPPRVISLQLQATYAGSASCPASLDVELATEWVQRTPASLELAAVFFPMAAPTSPPPAGVSPTLPAPAGCFRRDLSVTFAGDDPTGVGCTITSLDPTGDHSVTPGPGQGDGGRRYAVHADVLLDFGSTPRWGVQLWVRRALNVGASPSAWSPDPAHPAMTTAGSPVPVQPLPPPAPPGVPLGSTLDAQGCSHVRVHWTLPAASGVRTVVVWEVAETALRQRCGLPSAAPDTDPPGVRLAALWAAYDALAPADRRNAFRRLREVDGTVREIDVALPKGSTDIHLFTVTAITSTGVESPWPSGPGAPHEHLQAVIAPRLRRPAPPLARSSIAADGTVTIELHAASPIPVTAFRLFRTRSEVAARSVETMGPAFAQLPAAPTTPASTDPLTGDPVYAATLSAAFDPAWDPWLIRTVAVPVATLPVQGVRGLPSLASDVASVLVPPDGPPDLAPLEYDLWGDDHRGVVVRSSTSAPARATALGTHRLSARAGAEIATATAIEMLPETALASPPAEATTSPVLERGARTGGRSPLALWFTRPVAADAVDVTLRLTDPLGRSVEQTVTVPGWIPPPAVHLVLVRPTMVPGRGVVAVLDCDAPFDVSPPYVMEVRAVQIPRVPPFLLPERAVPGRTVFDLPGRGRGLHDSEPLDATHVGVTPLNRGPGIQIVRLPPSVDPEHDGNYAVWVPLTGDVAVVVSVVAPDGGRVYVTGRWQI